MEGEEITVDYKLLKEILNHSVVHVNIFDAGAFDTFYLDDNCVYSQTRGYLGLTGEGILKILQFAHKNNNFECSRYQYEKENLVWKRYKK